MKSNRRRAVAAAVTAGCLVAPLGVSAAGADDEPHTTKTLVIGIDGASFDFLDDADMPHLDALMARGMVSSSNLYGTPLAGTISGPGWSTIATGVWPDKHNVVDNNFTDPHFDAYPDYLTRIEASQPQRSTAVVATWAPIATTVFGADVDSRVQGGDDAGTTAQAVAAIAGGADDLFVHLDEVDGAGHSGGTNDPAYGQALAKADAEIGQILDAVSDRPSDEDWTIVVTADHGHTPTGGHGGSSPAEREVFVIATGPGIEPGMRHDVKISDIAPTVLAAVDITAEPQWALDGTAVVDLEPDDFDTLRPALQPQVDETRPGSDVLGWTHEAPDGWSIDNSCMPAGGVSEWSGWAFTTDEFWTNVELGQGRETSVRTRDVFAVADSDEWDDKPHSGGPFDSTLISPSYPLSGAAKATLSFETNYVIDGPQTAQVLVSFDGAAPQVLKAYTANTNAREQITFDVPTGATSAQFQFHYTGTNSAFWAVDGVALRQGLAPADTERPVATLTIPTTPGPTPSLQFQVDATDDVGLKRIVANVYKDGALVKSTQTAMNGATSGVHAATETLPDGAYTVKYNAEDLAGNISQTGVFAISIDATAPTAAVKDGESFTVGADGVYDLVSFALFDAGKISKVAINGVVKDLTDNIWSDVNHLQPGVFGAVRGENTMLIHDVAGNTSTVVFTLS